MVAPYDIAGQRVLFDSVLAEPYGVAVRALIQAVSRTRNRFPDDFMFQLSLDETRARSRPQLVILNAEPIESTKAPLARLARGRNLKYRPYDLTEQGVAMLSSVLRSPRAIQVNIEVMRAFVRLRQLLAGHEALAKKVDELESKYDGQFKVVFDALRELMADPLQRPIGSREQ